MQGCIRLLEVFQKRFKSNQGCSGCKRKDSQLLNKIINVSYCCINLQNNIKPNIE